MGSKVSASLNDDLREQLLAARLPSLPAIAIQLLGLARSASANIAQLTEIVGNDPAISAALVRMANSAAYRRIRPAQTLAQATSYLGFERSRAIALSATLIPALRGTEKNGLCYKAVWRRSLLAGVCARAICRRLLPEDTEEVFLATVLQDIGILALAQADVGVYADMGCEDYSHAEAVRRERSALKEDHAAVGAWLLDQWDFPDRFVRAVQISNNPALARALIDEVDFSNAVMAAGLLADLWMQTGRHPELDVYKDDLCKLLSLDWERVVSIFAEAASELPLVEALCDVRLDDIANIQLALTTLRESPEPETDSG
jgi:HD-like signal output (HDOD) protein